MKSAMRGGVKLSRYTLRVENNDGSYLLYNTFSQALAQIDSDTDEILTRALANKPLSSEEEEELISELKNSLLLRPDQADEDREIREWYEGVRTQGGLMSLTILTTNACNMACAYCFEGEALKGSHMPSKVADALVSWFQYKLDKHRPKTIFVRFFGGEPFLNHKGLLLLARKLHQLASERSIQLEMAATTNGTILPRELIAELAALGLKTLRVTLDGDEEKHNQKRPLKNRKNGFQIIWKNLEQIKELVNFELHVNAEKGDEESLSRLLPLIQKSSFRSSISRFNIKPLYRYNPVLGDLDSRLTPETTQNIVHWKELAKKNGLGDGSILKGAPCQIHRNLNFVVDPKGDLYPCPSAIGRSSASIGSIFSIPIYGPTKDTQRFFKEYSPLDHPKCSGCAYFPICGGGCRLNTFSLASSSNNNDVHCPGAQFDAMVPEAIQQKFKALEESDLT